MNHSHTSDFTYLSPKVETAHFRVPLWLASGREQPSSNTSLEVTANHCFSILNWKCHLRGLCISAMQSAVWLLTLLTAWLCSLPFQVLLAVVGYLNAWAVINPLSSPELLHSKALLLPVTPVSWRSRRYHSTSGGPYMSPAPASSMCTLPHIVLLIFGWA